MRKFVFVCVQNAGRSQMAAAFARQIGGTEVEVVSGGTNPAKNVNPDVVKVMQEKGIDLSHVKPQKITNALLKGADAIITMGCSASDFCPVFLLRKVEDWHLEDPHGQPLEKVRLIRDEIERRVRELLNQA
jgi:arsenate reductase